MYSTLTTLFLTLVDRKTLGSNKSFIAITLMCSVLCMSNADAISYGIIVGYVLNLFFRSNKALWNIVQEY